MGTEEFTIVNKFAGSSAYRLCLTELKWNFISVTELLARDLSNAVVQWKLGGLAWLEHKAHHFTGLALLYN